MNQTTRSTSTSIRTKVTHAHKLTRAQWGAIHCHHDYFATATEKTDGMAYEVGYDSNGFYTSTSHSGPVYNAQHYIDEAIFKFGRAVDLSISRKFADIHLIMAANKNLLTYLTSYFHQSGGYAESAIRGELFYLGDQTVGPDGLVSFVATKYDAACMGLAGMFVVHSKLEINNHLSLNHLRKLSDDMIIFDHDLPEPFDVRIDLNGINTLMEFDAALRDRLSIIKPKWGPETEGYILHSRTKTQGLIKVVDPEFMSRKDARYNKPNS